MKVSVDACDDNILAPLMNKVPVPACTRRSFKRCPSVMPVWRCTRAEVARRSSPALMGSVAEEGCVILVRDVCKSENASITTGGELCSYLAAFGRIWPLLEHDAANALEPGLSSLRPELLSGRHRSQTCSPFLAPLRPDVVTAPFVFSDSKAPRSTLLGRHNGRRRPLSRIRRDDRVQRDGAPGAQSSSSRALGLQGHRRLRHPTCAAG
jgi:hypothetical protein